MTGVVSHFSPIFQLYCKCYCALVTVDGYLSPVECQSLNLFNFQIRKAKKLAELMRQLEMATEGCDDSTPPTLPDLPSYSLLGSVQSVGSGNLAPASQTSPMSPTNTPHKTLDSGSNTTTSSSEAVEQAVSNKASDETASKPKGETQTLPEQDSISQVSESATNPQVSESGTNPQVSNSGVDQQVSESGTNQQV